MTFLCLVYNEAQRIRNVLAHAEKWADAIVILDKGSTDGTLDICRGYGDRVRIVSLPFSERGQEDLTLIPESVPEGWIFFCTCSEIPTRRLIEECRQILATRSDELDLIYIPRLMYFFGRHRSPDNGGVAYYPFLFHRDRVVITNDVHDNFHARDPARTARIPYAEDCCVHHLTHPTVRSFWLSSLGYFAAENQKSGPPEKAIRDCFKNIEKLSQRMLLEGENWLPFYCALASYELGKALSLWEKAQGPDRAAQTYSERTEHLLAREWTGAPTSPPAPFPAPIRLADANVLKPLVVAMAKLPYLLVKLSLAFRRWKIR